MPKKCFFLVIVFFSLAINFVFARNLSVNEEKALFYLKNLCFEITRYNITGFSSMPEPELFKDVSKNASLIMSRRRFSEALKKSLYLCEYYFPEKIGVIDCSFSKDDLYSVSNLQDDFDWVEQTLLAFSSSENAASQSFGILDGEKILEMLENNDSRGLETGDDGKITENIPQEFSYTKNDGSLRRFSYDGEQFSLYRYNSESVLVNSYGNTLNRKTFDSMYRIVKTERFKLGNTAKQMVLLSQIDYDYSDDAKFPSKTVEEQILDKKRIEKNFDEDGKIISISEGHYKTDEKNEGQQVFLNDKKSTFVYDEKGRIKEEETVFWKYKTNLFLKTITEERKIKNVYDYSLVSDSNNMQPNLQFFENDSLHLERNYTSHDSYSEKMYFEDGFSVEVFYENGMRKTEIIYLNEKETRRREFEY